MDALAWFVLKWGGVVACSFVLVACVCRVNLMRVGEHKRGWLWLYTLAAPFAGGVLIDLLTDRSVDWYCCFGIAAFLLHIVVTRRLWQRGAPSETRLKESTCS